jgi:hypothetical protein
LGETAHSQIEDQPLSSDDHSRAADAQNLLDRWANSHIFDPYGPPKNGIADSNRPVQESSESTIPSAPTESAQHSAPPTESAEPTSIAGTPNPREEDSPAETVTRPAADASANSAPATSSLSETSDELDRLTNDILSRVARITEDAQQPQPELATATNANSNVPLPMETAAETSVEPQNEAPSLRPADAMRVSSDRSSDNSEPNGVFSDQINQPVVAHQDPRPVLEDVGSKQWRIDAPDKQPTPARAPVPRPHTPTSTTVPAESIAVEHRELKSAISKFQDEHQQGTAKSGNWFGGIGQALAYIGILGLTAGTSLVILGYFGGPTQYAPTGWLITTVGQMLLFLGVVTLVSAGMEQTTVEVKQTVDESLKELTAKLNDMGDRIIRIEHRGHEPGPPEPHFNSRVRTRDTKHVSR